jgi:hypothetical protein
MNDQPSQMYCLRLRQKDALQLACFYACLSHPFIDILLQKRDRSPNESRKGIRDQTHRFLNHSRNSGFEILTAVSWTILSSWMQFFAHDGR